MKSLRLILASIVVPVVFGCAGALVAVITHPAANIDRDGWRLAWTGLGSGALIGLACVWSLWRRRSVR